VQDVTINQDQTRARQIYAGADGQITELDIVRTPDLSVQINNELTVLLDSFSSQGVEVTGELVRELLTRIQNRNRGRVEAAQGTNSPITGEPLSTNQNFYFFDNPDEGYNLYKKGQAYFTDQNADGTVGAGDILLVLSAYGASDLLPETITDYINATDLIAEQYNASNAE
jgi:hypothetical protein